MFQAPFITSIVFDIVIISLYGFLQKSSNDHVPAVENFALVLLIFSVFRIALVFPLLWIYSKDNRIKNGFLFHAWLFINLVVVITLVSLVSFQNESKWKSYEFIASMLSIVSILSQALCIRHLRSSVLPERHVVLDFSHGYIKLINSPLLIPSSATEVISHYNHAYQYPIANRTSYIPDTAATSSNILPSDSRAGGIPSTLPPFTSTGVEGRVMHNETSLSSSASEFMAEMKKKIESARMTWDTKIDKLKVLLSTMNNAVPSSLSGTHSDHNNFDSDHVAGTAGTSGLANAEVPLHRYKSKMDTVFEYILILFTSRQSSLSGEELAMQLESLYVQAPWEVTFFIPQFAVFLLYGSFDTSVYLQPSVLRICQKSYAFSHKFYWFIRSFSLTEAGVTPQGVVALESLMAAIEIHCGSALSTDKDVYNRQRELKSTAGRIEHNHEEDTQQQQLWSARSEDEPTTPLLPPSNQSRNVTNNHSSSSFNGYETSHGTSATTCKHMLYEPLLDNNNHSSGSGSSQEMYPLRVSPVPGRNTPSLLPLLPTYSALQQSSSSSTATAVAPWSPKHMPPSGEASTSGINVFRQNVLFWDQLTGISREVGPVHPSKRLTVLWGLLHEFTVCFLPQYIAPLTSSSSSSSLLLSPSQTAVTAQPMFPSSDASESKDICNEAPSLPLLSNKSVLYIPLGDTNHRLVAVLVEECFAFATRERAPLFLCFEVVDDLLPTRKKSKNMSYELSGGRDEDDMCDGGSSSRNDDDVYIDPDVISPRSSHSRGVGFMPAMLPHWSSPIVSLPPFVNDMIDSIAMRSARNEDDEAEAEVEAEEEYKDMTDTANISNRTTPKAHHHSEGGGSCHSSSSTKRKSRRERRSQRKEMMLSSDSADSDSSSHIDIDKIDLLMSPQSPLPALLSPAARAVDLSASSSASASPHKLYMNIIADDSPCPSLDEAEFNYSFSPAAYLGQWSLRDTWSPVNGVPPAVAAMTASVTLAAGEDPTLSAAAGSTLRTSGLRRGFRDSRDDNGDISRAMWKDASNGKECSSSAIAAAAASGVDNSDFKPHTNSGSNDESMKLRSPSSPSISYGTAQTRAPAAAVAAAAVANLSRSDTSATADTVAIDIKQPPSNRLQLPLDSDKTQPVDTASTEASAAAAAAVSPSSSSSSAIVVFKEAWAAKEARHRVSSPYGHLPGWRLMSVILKSGDDLRQEQCAAQLIRLMHQMLIEHSTCEFWLKPYDILALSPDCGLIEAVPDTVSLDALRKKGYPRQYKSLLDFFHKFFGLKHSNEFLLAQNHFIASLATYCIVCYIISIKDRHNGNILLDNKGHIIHIDYGYILAKTPGGNFGFEKAPFKLTREFVQVMGGVDSRCFHRFRELCVQIFMTLRRRHHRIVLLLEMLAKGNEHLDCFGGDCNRVIEEMRQRFLPDLHDNAAIEHVHSLIDQSLDSWTTTCYDRYQRCCVGIF